MEEIGFRPVGLVKNGIDVRPPGGWKNVLSRLEIDASFSEGLDGLEDFSHIIVVFHFHKASPGALRVHPERRSDLPEVGVFSTRSPGRPNGIGLQVVRLLGREGDTLLVKGLDAYDGTPILDIKGFFETKENDIRVPEWVRILDSEEAFND